jgi:uncharacterized RDD family membrane protein YckC
VQSQTALPAIGNLVALIITAIWFSICGVFLACFYTITVLFGNIGMSGEMEREGIAYWLAAIGYFELFWFSLSLKHGYNQKSNRQ